MGNPAGVRAKKREKRRKKYEQRLGIGAFTPPRDNTAAPAKPAPAKQ